MLAATIEDIACVPPLPGVAKSVGSYYHQVDLAGILIDQVGDYLARSRLYLRVF
jgi:hypothetical protein